MKKIYFHQLTILIFFLAMLLQTSGTVKGQEYASARWNLDVDTLAATTGKISASGITSGPKFSFFMFTIQRWFSFRPEYSDPYGPECYMQFELAPFQGNNFHLKGLSMLASSHAKEIKMKILYSTSSEFSTFKELVPEFSLFSDIQENIFSDLNVSIQDESSLYIRIYFTYRPYYYDYLKLYDFEIEGETEPAAVLNASIDYEKDSYCTGGTTAEVILTGTEGGTFSSSEGLAINASTGSIDLANSRPGTYTVSYSISGEVVATTEITLLEPPLCQISGTAGSLCPSSTHTFSAPDGMTEYEWSVTGNAVILSGQNEQNLSVKAGATPNEPFMLNLTVKDVNGCISSCSKQISVSSGPPVFTTFPENQDVFTDEGSCSSAVTYSASTEGSPVCTITYEFTGKTAGSGTGTGSGSVFNLGTTNVMLTAINDCGSANHSFQITVTDNQPPVIAAAADISQSADAQQCSAVVSVAAPTVSDNCSEDAPVGTRDDGLELDAPYPVGETTITWNFSDASGNAATPVTQKITVTDNEAPVIAAAADINQFTAAQQCSAVVTVAAPTVSENCSDGAPVGKRNDGLELDAPFPVGETTITWNFSDASGNAATPVTQTITVTDNEAPVIAAVADINQFADPQQCNAVVSVAAPKVSDNCSDGAPVGKRNDGLELDAPYPVGETTITWNFSDASGNAATPVTQKVTVTDNEAPVIAAVADINQFADPQQCSAVVSVAAPKVSDNCSEDAPVGTRDDGLELDAPFPVGETTITWNFLDASGNAATPVTQKITVTDNEAPIFTNAPSDMTVECDGTDDPGGAFAAWLESFSGKDACSTVEITNNSQGLSDLCGATGSETVTFTLADNCGNFVFRDATFTIEDTTSPVIGTEASDETVQYDGLGNTDALQAWLASNGGASASDLCGDVTWSNDFTTLSDGCGATGSATVTFRATDECGNFSETTATFTIEDTTAPTIGSEASDETVQCDGQGNTDALQAWLASNGGASASDLCGNVTWSNDFTALSDGCGATGSATVIFRATDDCGNHSETTATFTIKDTTAPTIGTKASDETVECDGLGNTNALQAWLASNGGASASDLCGDVTWLNDFTALSDGCGATGSATVTFRATDECGNFSETTATFIIDDTTKPTIGSEASDKTVQCDGLGNTDVLQAWLASNGGASASDLCGDVTWSNDFTALSDGCGATGSATVTFRATDECGNFSETTATFTIEDTTAPTIGTEASDKTVQCDGLGNTNALQAWLASNGGASASDLCGDVTWSNDFTALSDGCGATGSATVTFRATDEHGNFSETTATFIIDDTTKPTIGSEASDKTVQCDGLGNTDVLQAWLASNGGASASDLCGDVTWSNDFTALSDGCGATGSATVTFRATDEYGNFSETTATFTIEDTTAPTIGTEASDKTVQCDGLGNTNALQAWLASNGGASASDLCGDVTWSNDFTALSDGCGATGSAKVTFRATDECGNFSETPATFTIEDTFGPTWQTGVESLDRITYCGQVNLLAEAQSLEPIATDNCSIVTYEKKSGAFSSTGDNGAGYYINTWVGKDECGNESSVFTQTITVPGVTIDASTSSNPVPLGATATVSASVVDESLNPVENVLVTFVLTYYDDYGAVQTLTELTGYTGSNGIITLSNVAVPEVKVYKVLTVAGNGCSESVAYLPVYDPSAGFVTGGGWIMSPAGAYMADETLTGKANFGFVAKYKKGRSDVEGNTEFHFHAAGMKFKSNFHESGSLVISGGKATYRGEGSINGSGSYKFTLVAFDGDWNDGTEPDRFRIKIWGDNGIVYDNGLGADENSNDATILGDNGIGGGSIVIHEVKSKKSAEISIPEAPAEVIASHFNAYPNPFTDRVRFEFVPAAEGNARIDMYDMTGRLVQTVFDHPVQAGVQYKAEFKPGTEVGGTYIYRVVMGDAVQYGKVIYAK